MILSITIYIYITKIPTPIFISFYKLRFLTFQVMFFNKICSYSDSSNLFYSILSLTFYKELSLSNNLNYILFYFILSPPPPSVFIFPTISFLTFIYHIYQFLPTLSFYLTPIKQINVQKTKHIQNPSLQMEGNWTVQRSRFISQVFQQIPPPPSMTNLSNTHGSPLTI